MDKQNSFDAQQQSSQPESSQSVNPLKEKKLSAFLSKGLDSGQENGLNGLVYLSEFVEERSHLLFPLLGYSLLVFALIDYIHVVTPLRFTEFLWEFQTIGVLVEHVLVPLMGFVLVFYRHQGYVVKWEKSILGFLSWVSLLVGLIYLLMVPLGIADTWRIYYANNAQIAYQFSQQHQQLQQIKGQLNQAKTDEQIKQTITSLTPQVRSEEIKKPQEFKNKYLAQLSQSEQSSKKQADTAQTNQTEMLIKDSVKFNLGALLSGTVFICIWHLTDWARTKEY